MADIRKGIVLTVTDDGARIGPCTDPGMVSMLLPVPDRLCGMLSKNSEVAYAVFEDGTGIIIGRMDGREMIQK